MSARVGAALDLVGMETMADRYPSELSGGQQQRVALARAVVNQPKVLLLDEHMAALDLKLRKRMRSEEHTYELQSQMRISYAVFVLIQKKNTYYIYIN